MKHKRGYYDVFIRTCAKSPSNIAVRHYKDGAYKNYLYSELYGVCEYISQKLQHLKCNKSIIGLVSERNLIIPCVIAACHKCCNTFMFLDPNQNVESVHNDIKFKVIITITDKDKPAKDIFNKSPDTKITVFGLNIFFYDLKAAMSKNHTTEHSFIASTSGSTGDPKLIQVPIQCIKPNIDDLTKMFNITHTDIIYFSTPLTFDPSMVEILLACMNGASLLIAPEKIDILFPENQQNSITFWQTTPSKFCQLSNIEIKNKVLGPTSPLKILALGGEPFSGVRRLTELKHWENKTKIFTLYGVTEMSCWACVAELDLRRLLNDREVPLGNCLSETELIVKPDHEKSSTGKIILVSKTRKCIILKKTIGNEEENSLRFIDTGDIGEVKNGTIYYRGRKDDIIKRFGNKINLQSIETTIMLCPRVKSCSCLWLPKLMILVVYFSSETLKSNELSDFLKCKLDDKHWPDKIVRVDNLPTNPHGKICRQILSKMYERIRVTDPQSLDSLKTMFMKELRVTLNFNFSYEDIKDKSFFSIGGTSFLAISMCNKLSLMYPQLGQFILPHLLSENNTIDVIMQKAQTEICVGEQKPTCKIKRSRSSSSEESQSCKKVMSSNNPVEFVVIWSYDTGKCVDASPTLFRNGHNLYVTVGSHSGKIVVMDPISGIVQSLVTINSRVEASVYCCFINDVPCGIVGAHDGTIVCFTLSEGRELWRVHAKATVKSMATSCNNLVYVAAYDGNIRCICLETGVIKHTITVAEQAISADLVLAKNEYILVGTLSAVCAGIHTGTNAVVWRGSMSSPVFARPVLYHSDKYVVFAEVNGEIHCRTVEKGIKIWKYQGVKGNVFSSIYVKDVDRLKWQMVFGCHDSKVYSINIKNFLPSLHWKTQLTSPVYSTPCGLSDKLILAASNDGKLCVLDSDNGIILAEYALPNETFSSPVVHGDYIFVGCRNDHLYSIKFDLNV